MVAYKLKQPICSQNLIVNRFSIFIEKYICKKKPYLNNYVSFFIYKKFILLRRILKNGNKFY